LEGAFFCKECGAQLLIEEEIKTTTIKHDDGLASKSKSGQPGVSKVLDYAPTSGALVTLHLIGRDAYLPISEEGEVILGRASEGQSMIPDIDLGKFQAFQSGVSRMHAAIRIYGDQMMITDLGSSNGTIVNEQKLDPYTPHPLKNGDVLSLGKFRIEVITKEKRRDSL
jgi:hypothetical protein